MRKIYNLRLQLLCLLTFFTLIFASSASAQTHSPRYVSMSANTKGYYEYLPEGYSTGTEKHPLIIFLIGRGQMGDGSSSQLSKVLECGLPTVIRKGYFPKSFTVNGETSKFIVITPQFHAWPQTTDINNIITYCINKYRVDASRIYLTGLSMGGGVTWDFPGSSAANAGRITGIVPIAGASGPSTTKAANIAAANVAVWATHNQANNICPVAYTNNYVSYINANSPNPAAIKTIFTSAPAYPHDAWTKTYDPNFRVNNKDIYEWMLQYKRTSPTTLALNTSTTTTTSISVAVTANSPVCAGSTLNLSATAVSGATYKWSGPNGFTSTAQSPSINSATSAAAGTYTVSVTVSGKVYTASKSVTVTAAQTYYKDYDKDGYGGTTKVLACSAPSGYVLKSGDCNDNNAAVNPGATEVKNGVDDDCDGQVDEGLSTTTTTTSVGRIEAEKYVRQSGVGIDPITSSEGGSYYLESLQVGDWAEYEVTVPTSGTYKINYRVYNKRDGAALSFKVNGSERAVASLPATGSWTTISSTVTLSAGKQTIQIYVKEDGWFINWFEIVGATTSTARMMSDSTASAGAVSSSEAAKATEQVKAAVLRMVISPNPTYEQFKVNLNGDASKGTVSVKVSDVNGKLVEVKNSVTIGETILLGSDYAPGIYFIQAVQGTSKTVSKAVKL